MATCRNRMCFLAVLALLLVCTDGQLTRAQQEKISLAAKKLPFDICGDTNYFDTKIVNGTKVALGAYPWMAAVGYSTDSGVGPNWRCGGSVITDQYVVTAAHCLDPKLIRASQPLRVSHIRLGELDLDSKVADGASPVDYEVEKVQFHPQYNNLQKTNDIGLIKMKTKVKFDRMMMPICLPSPEFSQNSFVGMSAVVIGWGETKSGIKETALTEATVYISSVEDCRANLTRVLPNVVVDERVVCASSPGKDSCQGDSGGPLMMYRRYRGKSRMFLLGVVSYGYKCAIEGYPGVYSRVNNFMTWIMTTLEL